MLKFLMILCLYLSIVNVFGQRRRRINARTTNRRSNRRNIYEEDFVFYRTATSANLDAGRSNTNDLFNINNAYNMAGLTNRNGLI